jgi:dienelactone hydrolase
MAQKDLAKRRAAVPLISEAVTGFFSGRFDVSARSLDRAHLVLKGQTISDSLQLPRSMAVDAIPYRTLLGSNEEFVVRLRVAYAPDPQNFGAVAVRLGNKGIDLTMGESASISVPASELEEGENSIEVRIGDTTRRFSVFVDPGLEKRLDRARASEVPIAKGFVELVRTQDQSETVPEWSEVIEIVEAALAGRVIEGEVRLARVGDTWLRAWLPKDFGPASPVVIAVHGAGGSENLFFEGYGAGIAVEEAKKRGWAIVAPRLGNRCIEDSLEFLKTQAGGAPEAVYLMGHSAGGAMILRNGAAAKPKKVALFAPAGNSIPEALRGVPIFLALGAQEIPLLAAGARTIQRQMQDVRTFQFQLFDPCEHYMIVGDAVPAAFRFFSEK